MKSTFITVLFSFLALPLFAQQKANYTDAEAGKHVGEEATVTGKVANVSQGKGMTFLNFGDRFPRQTFTGLVFDRNSAAVGDLAQYEGKEVSLTGRIALSPKQQPQIIIESADQLKLAGATPAPAPAPPAPVAVTTPAAPAMQSPGTPAPATTAAAAIFEPHIAKPKGKIALSSNWISSAQGGELTRKDLAKLFFVSGTASEETEVDTNIEVYPGVPFLTPLTTAKKLLKLDGVASSGKKIMTPGFPLGSFNAVTFNGVFAGGYTTLTMVTDNAEQVVSVVVVDSNTQMRVNNEPDTAGYHTYNFVLGRSRGTNDIMIKHNIITEGVPPGLLVVDSFLIDPNDGVKPPASRSKKTTSSSFTAQKAKTGKVMERSRWYAPKPFVNLIMRCVGQ